MGTFAELQTEVATALIDTPTRVLALIPSFINRAIRSLQTDHNFKVQKALLSAVTVPATRLLVVKPSSTNFKEWRGRPYRLSFVTGKQDRVNFATSTAEVTAFFSTTAASSPRFIVEDDAPGIDGNVNMNLWPLSDGNSDWADGQYRIFIPYWKFLADLTAAGETNWFTTNAHDYIVHTASGYGFQYDWNEQRMAVWRQTGAEFKAQIIKRDKLETLSEVTTLVPHWRGANDEMISE